MPDIFEWDGEKAESNLKKHSVSFEEAATVFSDSLSITIADILHSTDEFRFVTIGLSNQQQQLVIVHTDRGDKIRIISATLTTPGERRNYAKRTE